ncbi:MAG: UDP-3-O-(3-hydroxymyristoyl)glucosamine N-acyltransferase, partial [Chitinophagia bacterium]|nr:UDP-3-O-(3-hydroxymyristoyl)glucosamine N-acyltransferase [Chitinophagia bacterium]
DAGACVTSFAKIEEAAQGQLAFLANPKYEDHLYTTRASVVIVHSGLVPRVPVAASLVRVDDPYGAFAKLLATYQQMTEHRPSGIEQPSHVAPGARIGKDVYIGAFAYVAEGAVVGDGAQIYPQTYVGRNAHIGEGSVLHPGVKVYHDCVIGKHVVVHAGTIIGGDGFGFAPQKDGSYAKVPQLGRVVVEDHVEIGANTCIDRATMGATVIRKGTKLDNLVQIAHNVEVGSDTVIAAQAGISGSTKVGDRVQIGGQAGLAGHITIAEGSRINGQSGVTKSIRKARSAVNGTPAFEHTDYLRTQAVARKLPELEKRILELEALVRQLRSERV